MLLFLYCSILKFKIKLRKRLIIIISFLIKNIYFAQNLHSTNYTFFFYRLIITIITNTHMHTYLHSFSKRKLGKISQILTLFVLRA